MSEKSWIWQLKQHFNRKMQSTWVQTVKIILLVRGNKQKGKKKSLFKKKKKFRQFDLCVAWAYISSLHRSKTVIFVSFAKMQKSTWNWYVMMYIKPLQVLTITISMKIVRYCRYAVCIRFDFDCYGRFFRDNF